LQIADVLRDVIRERGPLTVAAFMEIALYDPDLGYYARAAQRSGRAGDFFTSVDVGPVFGELLEIQVAEMAGVLAGPTTQATAAFDLVEAGAGNGRLSADILRAARKRDPLVYSRTHLHLVEASPAARAAQRVTLGEVGDRLRSSDSSLPPSFEGVLIANELLDALPAHQVVMRSDGLHEVYVDRLDDRLVAREGPVSTPALSGYFDRLGLALEPGWRAEVSLQALAWIRNVARSLRRGFVLLIDYGHDARELYSPTHAAGTLTTFTRHIMSGPESPADTPPWLTNPGERDITAHVDFTSVRTAAEAEGLTTLGFLDQTYFLLGLLNSSSLWDSLTLNQRLALKTLLLPGGLGSTHKVLIMAKDVGAPSLKGCPGKMRVT
jgi:SAM-dependent MidA family methyltransferase